MVNMCERIDSPDADTCMLVLIKKNILPTLRQFKAARCMDGNTIHNFREKKDRFQAV